MRNLPFLDTAKVESHLPVGKGLLVQIAAVASDKRGHVITCGRHTHTSKQAQSPLSAQSRLTVSDF